MEGRALRSGLDRFRLGPPPPLDARAEPYRAFEVVDGNPASATTRLPSRLELRGADGVTTAGFYNAIASVQYAGDGSTIVLRQTPPVVIKGRNLVPLARAIVAGICVCVTQIPDAEKAEAGATVVTEIGYVERELRP